MADIATIDMIACVYGPDGDELYGCTDDTLMGRQLDHWNLYGRDTFVLWELKNVPLGLAENVVDHGHDFFHQGGFQFHTDEKAWRAVEPYATEIIDEYVYGDITEDSVTKVGMIQSHRSSIAPGVISHTAGVGIHTASATRVADRYMTPVEVDLYTLRQEFKSRSASGDTLWDAYQEYETTLDNLYWSIREVERVTEKAGLPIEPLYEMKLDRHMTNIIKRVVNNPWVEMMNAGLKLADIAMHQHEVPKAQARKFTSFARIFMTAKRFPRQIFTWSVRHEKSLRYGLEIVEDGATWRKLTEGAADTEQVFKLGKFTVHNTEGVSGKRLDFFKDIINKASKVSPGSKIPGFRKVLYGDIYLVGSLRGARTLAWYHSGEDRVYLRTDKRMKEDPIHSLVHELSHRYWQKFADPAAKKAWGLRHIEMSNKRPDISEWWPVKVGDPVPFGVKWQVGKRKYVTTKPGQASIRYDLKNNRPPDRPPDVIGIDIPGIPEGRRAKVTWYKDMLRKHSKLVGFPSNYASTNAEEHFCEAVGFRALNQLAKEHKEALARIFKR